MDSPFASTMMESCTLTLPGRLEDMFPGANPLALDLLRWVQAGCISLTSGEWLNNTALAEGRSGLGMRLGLVAEGSGWHVPHLGIRSEVVTLY